ncbi:RdlA protein, partial [Streptomyces sp. BE147]|nr:RdlA protein [Streptomyces sp. BE147]
MMAGAAVAVSLNGLSAAAAPTAMANGNDGGTTTHN